MAGPRRECGGMGLLLAVLTVVSSAGTVCFNKYLIHGGHFPFVVPLVMLRMATSFVLNAGLCLVRPSLFPSLTDPTMLEAINTSLFLRGLLPIGALFEAQLVLSSAAYVFVSAAFIQMMKESNLVLVYLLSLLAARESFKCRSLGILVSIIMATVLTVRGEVNFSAVGFTLQASSQLAESGKVVLSSILLTKGVKLDAFSYVLLVTPACFALSSCLLLFLWLHPVALPAMAVPSWADFAAAGPILAADACVSYATHLVSALFIKHSSPVAYILSGVVKDATIVLTGAQLWHERVTHQQSLGFAIQLSLIFLWTITKAYPGQFEEGLLPGIIGALGKPVPLPTGSELQYGALEEGGKARAAHGPAQPHSKEPLK